MRVKACHPVSHLGDSLSARIFAEVCVSSLEPFGVLECVHGLNVAIGRWTHGGQHGGMRPTREGLLNSCDINGHRWVKAFDQIFTLGFVEKLVERLVVFMLRQGKPYHYIIQHAILDASCVLFRVR